VLQHPHYLLRRSGVRAVMTGCRLGEQTSIGADTHLGRRWVLVPIGNSWAEGDGGAMKTPRMTSSAIDTGGQPHLHRKNEILQRLQHERDTRLAQVSAMEADKPNANEGLVTAQTTAIRMVLAEIDAAVDRVQDGSYGVCRGCQERIPVGRLEILPYVRYCVRCQQQAF